MSKCKSCGAEIKWIKMASGKNMPCDAAPISYSEILHPASKSDDFLTLVTDKGTLVRTVLDPGGDKLGYTSHFATCPNANAFRRRGRSNES